MVGFAIIEDVTQVALFDQNAFSKNQALKSCVWFHWSTYIFVFSFKVINVMLILIPRFVLFSLP